MSILFTLIDEYKTLLKDSKIKDAFQYIIMKKEHYPYIVAVDPVKTGKKMREWLNIIYKRYITGAIANMQVEILSFLSKVWVADISHAANLYARDHFWKAYGVNILKLIYIATVIESMSLIDNNIPISKNTIPVVAKGLQDAIVSDLKGRSKREELEITNTVNDLVTVQKSYTLN